VQLEHAVTAFTGASMIVSRLDADVHATTCRIAAHGTILTGEVSSAAFPATFPPEDEPWRMINVVKPKRKLIAIDRVLDERTCISKSVTAGSQNQDPSRFVGAKVALRKVRPSSTTTAAAAQAAPAGAAYDGVHSGGGRPCCWRHRSAFRQDRQGAHPLRRGRL
jgi:hypothetical protein